MIDWFSMAVGAFILSSGWGAGRLAGLAAGKRKYQNKPPKPPELECSCRHGYGTHDLQTGSCLGSIKRANKWGKMYGYSGSDHEIGWEYVQCPCLHYDGPQPIDQIVGNWAPPVPLPKKED